nr:hypothetical protein [Pseudomonas sp.]
MITDAEFTRWLRADGVHRCALVEVDTDTPRFLSVFPYATLPTDPVPNMLHSAVVEGGVAFNESLSLDGNPSISYGDIELNNHDGSLDAWLDDVWVNRAVRVYLGDVSWSRQDFRLIMTGVCADIGARNPGTLNIKLREKLQRLNTPVTETTLGGTTANKDRLIPVLLGEAHNIEPLLTNPATHEYQFHDGAAERAIEVRDTGAPVGKVDVLTSGKVRLTQSPTSSGQVTISAQGDKAGGIYRNTVAKLIERLVTGYGKASERFTAADIDAANFAAFDAAHPQPVGLYLRDRANVIQCCQELAASVGAQMVVSRLGLLRLQKVSLPPAGTPTPIRETDYEYGSLQISSRTAVQAAVKIGYARNWTLQQNTVEGIPAEHKSLYAQEYLTATAKDQAVADAYRLMTEPEQENTLLLRGVDAQAEANRRLALWRVPRTVFSVDCYAGMLTLSLGQAVTLYGNRYGLQAGKLGLVIGLRSDWVSGRMTVEVLV